jgi:2-methylcitrate dehydratase PrpD
MIGHVGLHSFDSENYKNLLSSGLLKKVSVCSSEPFCSAYPSQWGAGVTVVTESGKKFFESSLFPLGDPENSISDEGMIEKAMLLLKYSGLGIKESSEIVDSVLEMPNSSQTPSLMKRILK